MTLLRRSNCRSVPQQAALVLKKLVEPSDLNARIYSQKGTLILDSDTLFGRGTPRQTARALTLQPRRTMARRVSRISGPAFTTG